MACRAQYDDNDNCVRKTKYVRSKAALHCLMGDNSTVRACVPLRPVSSAVHTHTQSRKNTGKKI